MEKMICIAGFGDDASMFDALIDGALSSVVDVVPFNLPGFGAPPVDDGRATLETLAQCVAEKAQATGATIVLAHSVASIIASLAARRQGSPIATILSLEGNLTAEDAYFSGTAAGYETPEAFRAAFLERLAAMDDERQVIARYRRVVEKADPTSLWRLGCDAHAFSQSHSPGAVLVAAGAATYLYNPENLPAASIQWLERHDPPRVKLPNASHWASVDCPKLLAEGVLKALGAASSLEEERQ